MSTCEIRILLRERERETERERKRQREGEKEREREREGSTFFVLYKGKYVHFLKIKLTDFIKKKSMTLHEITL